MSVAPSEPQRLKDLVTPDMVAVLLIGRSPRLLSDSSRQQQIRQIIAGKATEVADIVGDPPPATVVDLAVWGLTLGVASVVETSMFPEQQIGDDGRGQDFRAQYLAVLEMLRGSEGAAVQGGAPRGSFPPSQRWPETPLPNRWPYDRAHGYPVGYSSTGYPVQP